MNTRWLSEKYCWSPQGEFNNVSDIPPSIPHYPTFHRGIIIGRIHRCHEQSKHQQEIILNPFYSTFWNLTAWFTIVYHSLEKKLVGLISSYELSQFTYNIPKIQEEEYYIYFCNPLLRSVQHAYVPGGKIIQTLLGFFLK